MTSPNFPRNLEIRLNPELTATIKGSADHAIDIPRSVVVHKTEEDEAIETVLMKDRKSQEIAHLRELVARIHHEVEHHQNMSNFYRGEVEHVKETLALVKRKMARIMKLICFKE
ncbi:hypothetical protein AMTR_s00117p00083800 [Amborella trichopoda]|uniref:Uncharacterized protein n=1 Tax=Amborella trichopoda TaxID=13333 RepID=W1NSW0_AMBTC|nr:hypothetical protein AMTR_s00117p00083800 [Amborella trichopoda]